MDQLRVEENHYQPITMVIERLHLETTTLLNNIIHWRDLHTIGPYLVIQMLENTIVALMVGM